MFVRSFVCLFVCTSFRLLEFASKFCVFPYVRSYVRSFVCLFVRTSFRRMEFASKFCVKVSQVVYISATTYQKAFIFGPLLPWRVGIHSMTPDPRVHAPGWGERSKSRTPLKVHFLSFVMV